jgi:hypothetical protein
MLRRVAVVGTAALEEFIAFTIWLMGISELGTALAITSN